MRTRLLARIALLLVAALWMLGAQPEPTTPRRAVGTVAATIDGQRVPLADGWVFVRGAAGREERRVRSDAAGAFAITLASGGGAVCARVPGFRGACVPIERSAGDVRVDLRLEPSRAALYGAVTDADGLPCHRESALFGSALRAIVRVRPEHGAAREASVAASGAWAMAGLEPGSYTVEARCAATTARGAARVDREGAVELNLELPNRRPRIAALVAEGEAGPLRSGAPPGATLFVVADATDADGDALQYAWRDEQGHALRFAGPRVPWTLPEDEGRHRLWVEVSDGRGGFAEESLRLATGPDPPRFSGVVSDADGRPLASVRVDVNGIAATTDAGGAFRVVAAESERYVLRAEAPGRAPLLRVLDAPADGLRLQLRAALEQQLDPSAGAQLGDEAETLALVIPGASIVDPDGQRSSAPLAASLFVYGADAPAPGEAVVRSADGGDPQAAFVLSAFALELRDAEGRAHRLAPGAQVLLRANLAALADAFDLPPVLWIATLDPQRGEWRYAGDAVRTGAEPLWEGPFADPSLGALVFPDPNATCIRLRADRETIVVPLRVTLRRHAPLPGPEPVYLFDREFVIADYELHAVRGLVADAYYELEAVPEGTIGVPFPGPPVVRRFRAGAPTPFGGVLYPYADCQDRTSLLRRALPPAPAYLLHLVGPGSPLEASFYYKNLGEVAAKSTLEGWKTANGFSAAKPGVTVRFHNNYELGLGREVTCNAQQPNLNPPLACYIRKFGEPGGPVAASLDDLVHGNHPSDTVAIDTLPSGGVGFYAFGADGKRKLSAYFDGQGEKFVPNTCLGCHGGRFQDGHVTGGSFVPIDPQTHAYSPLAPRADQEAALRAINLAVARSQRTTTASRIYIERLYPFPSYCDPTPPPCEENCPPPGPQPPDCTDADRVAVAVAAVPPSWNVPGAKEVYQAVIQPHCQLCHLSQAPDVDWTNRANIEARADHVRGYVCDLAVMPNGFVAFRHFWQSREASEKLLDFLGKPHCPLPKVKLPLHELPATTP